MISPERNHPLMTAVSSNALNSRQRIEIENRDSETNETVFL